ncbi:hypothetical protein ACLIMP_25350 (plasmid) [Novosphingobium aerophilum]|jgi:hypothetical protein|uniref:Uncharacterized protein n=1 Tax=Sphingobium vermicomposti TaxID=529005 RepID=A0A846M3L7_9SPHN|nr:MULTISPECIES: hypothetical protein [Sphingobium]NIJ15360.1 hypothetical protein [Sphingobium vermicomposti]
MKLLSSLLIALAMLVSSVSMASGTATAMPHQGAMEMASVAGHCAGSESPSHRKSPEPGMHCAVACAAFPAMPPLIEQLDRPTKALYSVAGQKHLIAITLERDTPPPRMIPGN